MIQTLFLALMLSAAAADTSEPTLPTPYTTEQIRDAWREGLSMVVRTRDGAGERFTRRTVVEWSPEAMTLRVQPVDPSGAATGAPTEMTAKWEELRQHAVFPAARATRERASRATPLGRLDGWLYRVQGEGSTSEFFFADDTPGMPVFAGELRDGKWLTESELLSRTPAPPHAGNATPQPGSH